MKGKIGYRIDNDIKSQYDKFITNKYGHKQNRCGSELEKLIKFNLALEGDEEYQDDPDVLALLDKVGGSFPVHTHKTLKNVDVSSNIVVDLLEEIKDMKAEMKQLRAEVKGKPSKKTGSLAEFKRQFRAEYGAHKQVSRRDIVRFVADNYGVCDSRSIKNRIDFLIAQEVIEPFAQNVYNIQTF